MEKFAVMVLCLAACATPTAAPSTRTEMAEQAIDDTLDAFEGAAPACADQRTRVQVIELDAEAYYRDCPPDSDACFKYLHVTPTILVRAHAMTDDRWIEIMTHEATHWILACTTGDADPEHLTDVW